MSRNSYRRRRPDILALRPGDRFTPHHIAMLTAQGFTHAYDGTRHRVIGPPGDDREVWLDTDAYGVIRAITVDGLDYRFITLPIAPGSGLSPYDSQGRDPHADEENDL